MKLGCWSLGICVALGAWATFPAYADVSVGAVLPLTGASASIGEDQRRGIELAVAKINAQGGVLGQKLQVRIEDSGGTANTALDAARKLATVERVPLVLGEFSSSVTIPVGQFLVRQGDVHVNIGSSSQQVRKIGAGSFSTIGLDDQSARFAAQDVYDRKLRRVALIAPNNGYGQGIATEFKKRFEALGGTIVSTVLYTEGQSTYRRELEQASRAQPDGYVYSAYGQEAATLNRQAFEMRLNQRPWYGIYLTMCTSDTPARSRRGRSAWRSRRSAAAPPRTRRPIAPRTTRRRARPSAATRTTRRCCPPRQSIARVRPIRRRCVRNSRPASRMTA